MEKKPWKKTERAAGSVYVLIALLAFFNAFWYGKPWDVLWLCYWAALLIGIGLLTNARALVWSQLFLLFIPDVIWTLDAAVFAVRGSSLLGISDYFFALPTLAQQAVSLQHPLTVLLGMYALARWKGEKKKTLHLSGIIAVLESAAAFALARLLTTQEQNINCVYRFCGSLGLSEPYVLWWFVAIALTIALTYGLFARCVFQRIKEHTLAQSPP